MSRSITPRPEKNSASEHASRPRRQCGPAASGTSSSGAGNRKQPRVERRPDADPPAEPPGDRPTPITLPIAPAPMIAPERSRLDAERTVRVQHEEREEDEVEEVDRRRPASSEARITGDAGDVPTRRREMAALGGLGRRLAGGSGSAKGPRRGRRPRRRRARMGAVTAPARVRRRGWGRPRTRSARLPLQELVRLQVVARAGRARRTACCTRRRRTCSASRSTNPTTNSCSIVSSVEPVGHRHRSRAAAARPMSAAIMTCRRWLRRSTQAPACREKIRFGSSARRRQVAHLARHPRAGRARRRAARDQA